MPAAEGRRKMGVVLAFSFLFAASQHWPTDFRGPSANAGWAVWRIDSRNVRQPSFLEILQRKRLDLRTRHSAKYKSPHLVVFYLLRL